MAKFFIKLFFLINFLILSTQIHATEHNFDNWLENFKKVAISEGVSENTVNDTLKNIKFLPKVIEYDRYQPNFMRILAPILAKEQIKKVKKVDVILSRKKLINKVRKYFSSRKWNYF